MKEMKEKNIIVRFARKDELEQVNHIRKQVHELHCNGRLDFFKVNGWDAIRDTVKERFASENSGVIAAFFENEIAGFAIVQYINKMLGSKGILPPTDTNGLLHCFAIPAILQTRATWTF